MKASRKLWLALLAFVAVGMATSLQATAQQRQQQLPPQRPPQQQAQQQQQQQQQQAKPNILFIMGDDLSPDFHPVVSRVPG